MMRGRLQTAAVLIASALGTLGSGSAPAASPQCDRACLGMMLNSYLTAAEHHDPKSAPLAANYRGTENGAVVAMGAGMWTAFDGPGEVQRRYFDTVTGQAAYFGTIKTKDGAGIATIRIKVVKGKIADAEWIYSHQGETMVSIPGIIAEPPRPATAVAASKKSTREQLIAAVDSYFEGLERHESAGVLRVKGCPRVENGTRVTGMRARPAPGAGPGAAPPPGAGPAVEFDAGDCGDNLDRMVQIDRVVARRYPLIDTEAGAALGYALFLRQPGVKRADGTEWPRLLLSELFTGESGKISGIYAAMHYLPPEAPSATGW